ncbi:hypothetical protein ACQ4LE_005804 [Meloidogyne hapla]
MNENLENSIDGLSTSCSSCCLSQNIIESLKQRIEKLESEMEKKNLTLENINLKLEKQNNFFEQHYSFCNDNLQKNDLNENLTNFKQLQETNQFLAEKTRDQHVIIQQNFQIQQMQSIIAEKDKQIRESETFVLNNQIKDKELEALRKEIKLFNEKYLEKLKENTQLNKKLDELKTEMSKIKEEFQLTLTELSKYKEENQDLSNKYLIEKSGNGKKFINNIFEEFKQKRLENDNLINKNLRECLSTETFSSSISQQQKFNNSSKYIADDVINYRTGQNNTFSEVYGFAKEDKNNLIGDENKNIFELNKKLNDKLEELNIEINKIKEEHQLTLTELSKYKEEFCKNINAKSVNEKKFNDILEEFKQMKLENTKLINKLKESEEKINKYEIQNEKLEQANASLNVKTSELSSQLEKLNKNVDKNLHFGNVSNKIIGIYSTVCCEKRCIDLNISDGVCNSSNGYVRVHDDGKIKYHFMENEENNKFIELYAQNNFIKENFFFSNLSIFYFEVKMIKEQTTQLSYAMIGIDSGLYCGKILLSNYLESFVEDPKRKNHNSYQKFSWNDGDIFGCGFISPPKSEANNRCVFFTKNGNKIGSEILLTYSIWSPTIGLLSCSVETNFGNDLVRKPFCYDLSMFM